MKNTARALSVRCAPGLFASSKAAGWPLWDAGGVVPDLELFGQAWVIFLAPVGRMTTKPGDPSENLRPSGVS